MSDDLEKTFDDFADATEATLARFAETITALQSAFAVVKEENRSLREQLLTRSTPLEPVIDVEAIATRAASLVPTPKDGVDGKDGRDGIDGKDGVDGKDGTPGKDGAAGERGADGINGRDGKDGIVTREEVHELIEQRAADINVRSFADIYQGTFEPNKTYTRGLTATWDGSLWLSERDTNRQPGVADSGWKLITKRGRDGRDKR